MEEVLHLVCCASNSHLFSRLQPRQCSSSSSSSSSYPSSSSSSPSSSSSFSAYGGHDRRTSPARALRCSSVFQENRTLPLPKKPPKPAGSGDDLDGGGGGDDDGGGLSCLRPEMPRPKDSTFQEKVLFLDSVGVDLLAASAAHPLLLSTPLSDLRATADFLLSAGGFSSAELRRICGMCPEVLTAGGPRALAPVFTFLIREAAVDGLSGLRRAVRRRPRLLVSDVATRLRPTLYFLQMLGVVEIGRRHAPLLSCSVEEKLLPRIDFLQAKP
ncbi:unnamed protein product [Spirodela intermedia]|uniref:Uncharacterized protein n=1 Tax=Spirodela intermedia TaxID=51605 RepID=A0A7I8K850_SPIIN|nr:unnamed protein product [Spirodela intermedia]